MPEAKEDEEDMLDSAFDVNYTSRLCCQLYIRNKRLPWVNRILSIGAYWPIH